MEVESDLTRGRRRQRRRRRRHRHPVLMSGFDPTSTGDSLDECRFPEIERNVIRTHIRRDAAAAAAAATSSSTGGGCLSGDDDDDDVDLESGELEMVKFVDPPLAAGNKEDRDCRICHLKSGEESGGNRGEGDDEVVIDLGCSCKGDLGTAHKHCAETWFKIRGNTTCEICGSAATNVVVVGVGDEAAPAAARAVGGGGGMSTATSSSSSSSSAAAAGVVVVPVGPPVMVIAENGISWNGRRLVNILLASMILAFVISWLFHSKVLSS